MFNYYIMNGFNNEQKQDLEEVGFTNEQIEWFETTNINNDELYFDELYTNIMYEIFDNDKSPKEVFNEYINENQEQPNQGGRKNKRTKTKRKRSKRKRTKRKRSKRIYKKTK